MPESAGFWHETNSITSVLSIKLLCDWNILKSQRENLKTEMLTNSVVILVFKSGCRSLPKKLFCALSSQEKHMFQMTNALKVSELLKKVFVTYENVPNGLTGLRGANALFPAVPDGVDVSVAVRMGNLEMLVALMDWRRTKKDATPGTVQNVKLMNETFWQMFYFWNNHCHLSEKDILNDFHLYQQIRSSKTLSTRRCN